MAGQFSRRDMLSTTLGAGVALSAGCAVGPSAKAAERSAKPGSFTYCLNTSTIRGQKVGIVKEIEIAAKAGYQGIEPWIGGISKYQLQAAWRIPDRPARRPPQEWRHRRLSGQ